MQAWGWSGHPVRIQPLFAEKEDYKLWTLASCSNCF